MMSQMDYMLFLIVMVQFTAVTDQKPTSYLFVKVGDNATLLCENVRGDQDKCDSTSWNTVTNTGAKDRVKLGPTVENGKFISDRMSFAGNCSLVIKNVTVEDAGLYGCKQLSQESGRDTSLIHLSAVTMTECEDHKMVTLNCSVSTHEGCKHTVKWLYQREDVDKYRKVLKIKQSNCWSAVSFLEHDFINTSKKYELLECNITHNLSRAEQLFTLRPLSTHEKTDTVVVRHGVFSEQMAGSYDERATTKSTRTTENTTKSVANTTMSTINDAPTNLQGWWWLCVVVAAGLVALLIIVVAVTKCKRAERNKYKIDHIAGQSLNPVESQSAPETSPDTADPEDGVSYASISYIKKTSKPRVRGGDDDGEEGEVTYSTVKVSSTDPSDLYATITEPKK